MPSPPSSSSPVLETSAPGFGANRSGSSSSSALSAVARSDALASFNSLSIWSKWKTRFVSFSPRQSRWNGQKHKTRSSSVEGERTEERMTIDAWLSPLDVLKKPSVSSQANAVSVFITATHRRAKLSPSVLLKQKQKQKRNRAANHAPGTEASYRSGEAFRDIIESRRVVQSLDDP